MKKVNYLSLVALIVVLSLVIAVSGCKQKAPETAMADKSSGSATSSAKLIDLFPSSLPSGITQTSKKELSKSEIASTKYTNINELAKGTYSVSSNLQLPGEKVQLEVFVGRASSASAARSMIDAVQIEIEKSPGVTVKSTLINGHPATEINLKISFAGLSATTTSFLWSTDTMIVQVAGAGVTRDAVFNLAQSLKL